MSKEADLLRMLELACVLEPHRSWSIVFARNNFVPPVLLGQVLWHPNGQAFCTWAWLSPATRERWLAGEWLRHSDWKSGSELWLVDFVAPHGGVHELMELGRERIPAGVKARWRRSAKGNRIGFLTGKGSGTAGGLDASLAA